MYLAYFSRQPHSHKFSKSPVRSSPNVVHETQFHKCDQRSVVQHEVEVLSVQSEGESTGDSDDMEVMEELVSAEHRSTTNTVTHTVPKSSDPGLSGRDNSSAQSNQEQTSFGEFTPVITVDGDVETYRFQCSCPGLYLCSVTGLMFDMKGEGDVVYRIVPWNRRLLRQHHKKPAGPLFDITCVQQSVCQLHLPHCDISSTGGCQFLSVAHVKDDEDVEYISPCEITETHVVINITGFSGYGNVKEEDSPPDPVRALVLLFYRPPADPDLTSFLTVLLLPRNIVLRDVQRKRKASVGHERYIETSSHCKLCPDQFYTLSTCPQDNSVKVQPKQAEFDLEFDDNYIPSFQVILKTIIKNIELFLRDTNSSLTVWESEVCLPGARKRKLCEESALNLPLNEKLKKARSRFVGGISEPVVKSLLDKLLEKKVITDSERESVDTKQNREDKARLVIDTVRKKGEAASSDMIEVLCELDPSLCEHLGLE
ncbi:NACHT, LRR and PYD domains-containing protein 1b allele 3-like [Anabas testudineus]|uniref:NACHT, LRR and PYD domains-containing protein 1b allele 3-like n=1 Tax=Anabas testudineus TaxID=64144 RepID=UPI000E465489|nr:NACHT, LRR and PYD domains-containing protein 1b allele 3-like [Anabas testudineus]